MQTRANTKAVNHWFLMLFIVLIFLYFIGYVLGLGTKMERSLLLSFFRLYTLVYIHTFIPAYLPTYILSYPPFHENVYSDLFRISLSIFGFSKDNIYLCRRNNLYIITQQTEKIDEEIF